MNSFDTAYLDILGDIMDNGVRKGDRTGTGTLSRFGTQARFNLKDNRLPLLSLRKVFHRSFIHETLWFLSGSTDIQYLKENNVSIWDSWVKPDTARYEDQSDGSRKLIGGSIGTGAYGSQWRTWEDTVKRPNTQEVRDEYLTKGYVEVGVIGDEVIFHRVIDQIANIVELLKTNPDSRRILLVAFNPAKVDHCQLPPCHSLVQWWTRELTVYQRSALLNGTQETVYFNFICKQEAEIEAAGLDVDEQCFKDDPARHNLLDELGISRRALSCMLYMRSSDYPVGAVFNIPQYALLTHMLAQVTGMVAEELIFTGADCHVYDNQIDGVLELLQREGHEVEARVHLNPEIKDIDDFVFDDIQVTSYGHDDVIRFPVAV